MYTAEGLTEKDITEIVLNMKNIKVSGQTNYSREPKTW